MLIVNDIHLSLAGVASLAEPCSYCSRPLAAYPLVMSDDPMQTVYHPACAVQLATDLLVDLATFFSPPAPYSQLFVLTASRSASTMTGCSGQAQTEGGTHAVSKPLSD